MPLIVNLNSKKEKLDEFASPVPVNLPSILSSQHRSFNNRIASLECELDNVQKSNEDELNFQRDARQQDSSLFLKAREAHLRRLGKSEEESQKKVDPCELKRVTQQLAKEKQQLRKELGDELKAMKMQAEEASVELNRSKTTLASTKQVVSALKAEVHQQSRHENKLSFQLETAQDEVAMLSRRHRDEQKAHQQDVTLFQKSREAQAQAYEQLRLELEYANGEHRHLQHQLKSNGLNHQKLLDAYLVLENSVNFHRQQHVAMTSEFKSELKAKAECASFLRKHEDECQRWQESSQAQTHVLQQTLQTKAEFATLLQQHIVMRDEECQLFYQQENELQYTEDTLKSVVQDLEMWKNRAEQGDQSIAELEKDKRNHKQELSNCIELQEAHEQMLQQTARAKEEYATLLKKHVQLHVDESQLWKAQEHLLQNAEQASDEQREHSVAELERDKRNHQEETDAFNLQLRNANEMQEAHEKMMQQTEQAKEQFAALLQKHVRLHSDQSQLWEAQEQLLQNAVEVSHRQREQSTAELEQDKKSHQQEVDTFNAHADGCQLWDAQVYLLQNAEMVKGLPSMAAMNKVEYIKLLQQELAEATAKNGDLEEKNRVLSAAANQLRFSSSRPKANELRGSLAVSTELASASSHGWSGFV